MSCQFHNSILPHEANDSTIDMYLPMCIACYPDTTDRILHREHPAAEPSLHQRATMFDSRFGIVLKMNEKPSMLGK